MILRCEKSKDREDFERSMNEDLFGPFTNKELALRIELSLYLRALEENPDLNIFQLQEVLLNSRLARIRLPYIGNGLRTMYKLFGENPVQGMLDVKRTKSIGYFYQGI